jgi:hypothetical protein
MTLSLFNRYREELLTWMREYVAAVPAGCIEAEFRDGSTRGCVTFVLAGAERATHYYNAFRRPRRRPWTVHRYEPY